MTDPRYQPHYNYQAAAQFSALPSSSTTTTANRYISHSSNKHYISSTSAETTESEDAASETSSGAAQQRWRAFPATSSTVSRGGSNGGSHNTTTRGNVAGRWNPQQQSSSKSTTTTTTTTTQQQQQQQHHAIVAEPQQPPPPAAVDDQQPAPDPELLPLPSEDSLQSVPSTEVTSNVHHHHSNTNSKQSAIGKWRHSSNNSNTVPQQSEQPSGMSLNSNHSKPATRTWKRPVSRSVGSPPPPPEAHSAAARFSLSRSRSPTTPSMGSPVPSSMSSPVPSSVGSPTSTAHTDDDEQDEAFPDSPAATVIAKSKFPAPAASWIKSPESASGGEPAAVVSKPSTTTTKSYGVGVGSGGSAKVGGRSKGMVTSPQQQPSPSQQQQQPAWKQQLLKKRHERLSHTPQQQPKQQVEAEQEEAVGETAETEQQVTEKEATPPAAPRASLVSERLAKFGGGGGGSSSSKVSPQPTLSTKKYGKAKYVQQQKRRELATAPSDETTTSHEKRQETTKKVAVEAVRSPELYMMKTTTTTSGKQSSAAKEVPAATEPPIRSPVYSAGKKPYVPPPTQKSFVPIASSSSVPKQQQRPNLRSPPARKWTPPNKKNKNKTELEIVDQDTNAPAGKKTWVSPRSKRLQALAARADDDDAIGEVIASQSSTEQDKVQQRAAVKTPERPRRAPFLKQQDHQRSNDGVEPANEGADGGGGGAVIETPGKISVKDVKAKLWGGSGEKLKVSPVRAPAPPKIGSVDPTAPSSRAYSPPRSTSRCLPAAAPKVPAAPVSPPTSRIAKGLIDVSTPQGLAPPVRNSAAPRENISSKRKNITLPWMPKQHYPEATTTTASNEDSAQAKNLAMPDLPGSSGDVQPESPPKLVDIVSEEEHVEVLLGKSSDEHDVLEKSSETMESEDTSPPTPPAPQPQQPTGNGRSFKANVANVLSPGGEGDPPPWVKRRLEMEEEEKKSSEPMDSPQRSVSNDDAPEESFESPPSSPGPTTSTSATTTTTSPESSPKETIEPVNLENEISSPWAENHHNRSPSFGDLQVDEVAPAQHTQQPADSVSSPPSPSPLPMDAGRRPLSGRPSADESDFPLPPSSPPRRSSTSPAKQHKPPLSPTTIAKLQKAANFAETIDCPPSDDVEDEFKGEEEVDGPESFVETPPRSPMTPRGEKARPWTKDANSLSPASWQRRRLDNDESPFRNSSRENVSPTKSNAAQPDNSSPTKSTNPNQTPLESPGSSLSQMAAESIHALDFERVERDMPKTTLSEDGSESLMSNGGATASSASVPAIVPPEFRKTIADVDEDKPMDGGDEGRESPRVRVAERAKALAKWNGGLGDPMKGDDDDEEDDDNVNKEQKIMEEPPVSPIRRQGSGDGFDTTMSPRLNHRGVPIDDWHRNKSFNDVSYDENSAFNAPQFDDSTTGDKDWSMDDGGGDGDGDGGIDSEADGDGGTDLESADEAVDEPPITPSASENPTVASSVKPIGKPRKDSEPRKQKDRRKRKEARAQSPAAHKTPDAVVDDPFSLDAMAVENEMNNKSTTFEFDPFEDTFGEKVEFTETTEFTEASDFFGSANAFENFFPQEFAPEPIAEAAMGHAESKETTSSSAVSRNNVMAGTRSGSGSLGPINSDFWSYDADTSTFHDDDTARQAEI